MGAWEVSASGGSSHVMEQSQSLPCLGNRRLGPGLGVGESAWPICGLCATRLFQILL